VSTFAEERIAQLMKALPPAPRGWVQAAQELPLGRRGLDDIAARAEADAEFRQACLADLETALSAAGYELDADLLAAVRRRLSLEAA
jgi:hypothetical protein